MRREAVIDQNPFGKALLVTLTGILAAPVLYHILFVETQAPAPEGVLLFLLFLVTFYASLFLFGLFPAVLLLMTNWMAIYRLIGWDTNAPTKKAVLMVMNGLVAYAWFRIGKAALTPADYYQMLCYLIPAGIAVWTIRFRAEA